jgi:hypothetical protein
MSTREDLMGQGDRGAHVERSKGRAGQAGREQVHMGCTVRVQHGLDEFSKIA